MPKVIKDPVHGHIELSDVEVEILDLRVFQRLRDIKQLGMASLVYPGANHTRLEHCLGVMHLASLALDRVRTNSKTEGKQHWALDAANALTTEAEYDLLRSTARAAGLLHDLGHTPFSHITERLLEPTKDEMVAFVLGAGLALEPVVKDGAHLDTAATVRGKNPGEILSCALVLDPTLGVKQLLEKGRLEPLDVAAAILGHVQTNKGKATRHYKVIGQLISSPIDVDKFDYMLRDNYMTGADVAHFDPERFLFSYTVNNENELVLRGKALSLVANLISGRSQAYLFIYKHHKVVFFDQILTRILERIFAAGLANQAEYFSRAGIAGKLWDDTDIMGLIKQHRNADKVRPYYELLRRERRLKALWKNQWEYEEFLPKATHAPLRSNLMLTAKTDPERLESYLRDELGVNHGEVFVTVSKFKPYGAPGQAILMEHDGQTKDVMEDLHFRLPHDFDGSNEFPYIYVRPDKVDAGREAIKHYDAH